MGNDFNIQGNADQLATQYAAALFDSQKSPAVRVGLCLQSEVDSENIISDLANRQIVSKFTDEGVCQSSFKTRREKPGQRI